LSEVFSAAYSRAYDAIYRDKDYEGECDLLESLFARFATARVRRVLDLGCGTGRHSLALARRGYQVVGVDRSEAMLACARAKAQPETAGASFVGGDVRRLDLGGRFDAALMMFAVLGYQCGDVDVRDALACARRHLERGGLLLFDLWHAPAVLRQGPEARVRTVESTQGRLLRHARGELVPERRVCRVEIELRHESGATSGDTREVHEVRYFCEDELGAFLAEASFERLRTGAFPEFDREPDESTWSVLVAARAV
jgi:SAM-dependent methyltransferase